MENETLFTKIRDGEIPSKKLYQDELCFSILDINPINKGHALVISAKPYKNIGECPEETLCHMITIAKRIESRMRDALKCNGSNIIINNDPASGQEVPHLHIHVVPRYSGDGKTIVSRKESYADGEMDKMQETLKI